MSCTNSSRVLLSLRKAPVNAEVVVTLFCFSTPRICIHMCAASITTATPRGCRVEWIHSSICRVSRSCTCSRLENASTTRAILLSPVI